MVCGESKKRQPRTFFRLQLMSGVQREAVVQLRLDIRRCSEIQSQIQVKKWPLPSDHMFHGQLVVRHRGPLLSFNSFLFESLLWPLHPVTSSSDSSHCQPDSSSLLLILSADPLFWLLPSLWLCRLSQLPVRLTQTSFLQSLAVSEIEYSLTRCFFWINNYFASINKV